MKPSLFVPLAYVLGLGLWGWMAQPLAFQFKHFLFTGLLLGASCSWLWLFRRAWRPLFSACLLTCLLGLGRAYSAQPQAAPQDLARWHGQTHQLKFRLLTQPESHSPEQKKLKNWSCLAAPLADKTFAVQGKTRLHFQTAQQYQLGDVVQLKVRITLPPPRQNHGAFSYQNYLARQGVFSLSYGLDTPQRLDSLPENHFSRRLVDLRQDMRQRLEMHLPHEIARLLASLVVGESVAKVSDETASRFRDSGLSHVLAVSGFQVQLVILSVLGISRFLRLSRPFAACLALCSVWSFVLLTGGPASVLRAAAIGSLALLAYAFYRQGEALPSLCWGAVLLLVWQPLLLYDIGFQFSCLATLGLILHQRPLALKLDFLPPWMGQSLGCILAAQLWVAPAQLFHFGSFSWLFLPANLLAGFLINALTWLSLGALLSLYTLPQISLVFLWPAQHLAQTLLSAVELLLQLPQPVLYFRPLPLSLTLLLYTLFVASALPLQGLWQRGLSLQARRVLCCALVFSCLNVQAALAWQTRQNCPLRVDFLSVGQGDASVLQSHGQTYLIDVGPAWVNRDGKPGNAGSQTLLPFMRQQGIRQIDRVLISHAHLDHYGGLAGLLGHIPIKEIWLPPGPIESDQFKGLLHQALALGVRIYRAQNGQILELSPDLHLLLWQPFWDSSVQSATHHSDDPNNHSMVVQVIHQDFKMLFAGDLEQAGEQALLATPGFEAEHQLLKVPHHGSKTSSTTALLKALKAREAVISVGQRNRFRHPSPQVIQRYGNMGTRVWRTDQQGGICLCSQGQAYALRGTRG